ncbi:MAG: hypothetical protein V4631_09460 [Pseudomonadota bacterium]
MKDKEIIEGAYADALGALYSVMRTSYLLASGDKDSEKQADEAFKAGLHLARRVRDQALRLVG